MDLAQVGGMMISLDKANIGYHILFGNSISGNIGENPENSNSYHGLGENGLKSQLKELVQPHLEKTTVISTMYDNNFQIYEQKYKEKYKQIFFAHSLNDLKYRTFHFH